MNKNTIIKITVDPTLRQHPIVSPSHQNCILRDLYGRSP